MPFTKQVQLNPALSVSARDLSGNFSVWCGVCSRGGRKEDHVHEAGFPWCRIVECAGVGVGGPADLVGLVGSLDAKSSAKVTASNQPWYISNQPS